MLKRLAMIGLLLAALGCVAERILDLSMAQTAEALPAGSDEDWRRTSQGWVRFSPRVIQPAELKPAAGPSVPISSPATCLHPAALVVFLLLGTATACLLLPRGNSSLAARQSQTLF